MRAFGLPPDAGNMRALKAAGFSDVRLAGLAGTAEDDVAAAAQAARRPAGVQAHRHLRGRVRLADRLHVFDLRGAVRRPAECEADPSEREKIVILGGGPNRIGQGIEFDYCCCHACFALSEAGYETIMINCNPETVSTDYDTSDRLYFEPLTQEDVLAILDKERENGTLKGVIVQFGGQTPLKLAHAIEQSGVPILGTSVEFDRSRRGPRSVQAAARQARPEAAEERHRLFGRAGAARLRRPRPAARRAPVLCARRPGDGDHPRPDRARRLSARRAAEPRAGRRQGALSQRQDGPDQHGARQEPAAVRPLSFATRSRSTSMRSATARPSSSPAIMEHIEEAGIHSGDSACSLPPRSLTPETIARLEEETKKLALALEVGGLMNVQYALKDGVIYVLEVNPRASRTVPFVAKVIGKPIAKIASRIMAGESLAELRSGPRQARPCRGQGGGVPVRPLPRRRHRARAGDALDRRGDGNRPVVRDRLRQEPDRRRIPAAEVGRRVRLGARRRQGGDRRAAAGRFRRSASRSSRPAAPSASSPRTD